MIKARDAAIHPKTHTFDRGKALDNPGDMLRSTAVAAMELDHNVNFYGPNDSALRHKF